MVPARWALPAAPRPTHRGCLRRGLCRHTAARSAPLSVGHQACLERTIPVTRVPGFPQSFPKLSEEAL